MMINLANHGPSSSATRSIVASIASRGRLANLEVRRTNPFTTLAAATTPNARHAAGAATTTPTKQQQRRWINSSKLTVERNPRDEELYEKRPEKEKLVFGTTFASHMLMVEWNDKKYTDPNCNGWGDPKIVPYQNLSISPAASSLHYGLQCFEGMKAYKSLGGNSDDGDTHPLLYRPDMNMKRLQRSMERLCMPGSDFNHKELIACLKQLVKLDEKWIPYGEGYSLYLRPTVIATHPFLGLSYPESVLLYVITSPVGPYYKSGFKPVRLTADTEYVRAWPGGTGDVKIGGNYGPTMKAQFLANKHNYQQILWLFGENDEITEVGAMNVFFFLVNEHTKRPELVTAPLARGDILPGVTRDSILHLARAWSRSGELSSEFGDFDVTERYATMPEIVKAAEDGRLIEAFGAGTAAVVSPIEAIQYKGQDITVPATGEFTMRIWDELTGIQYGKIKGPDGWSINV